MSVDRKSLPRMQRHGLERLLRKPWPQATPFKFDPAALARRRSYPRLLTGLAIALATVLASLSAWAQAHDPLQYRGGPVLRNFTIYPLYYGKWDDKEIANSVNYLKGLAGYLSGQNAPANQQPMMMQYGVTGVTVAKEQRANTDNTDKPPGSRKPGPQKLEEAQIVEIIHANQKSGKLPSYSSSTLIFVFPAAGFTVSGSCGGHDYDHNYEWSPAYYARVTHDCGPTLDLVTAHEVFEASTDPAFNTWRTKDLAEAVDGCVSSVTLPFGQIPGAADNTQGGTCSTTGYTNTVLSGPCGKDDCWISALQIDPFTQKVNIDRPVVTQASYEYKQMIFRSGDQISVDAAGCVQTGIGWRRYVNGDRLYFGSLEIPGVLPKTRLLDLIGKAPVKIPTTAPTTLVSAILHYADDDYSYNGYNNIDGKDDQCNPAKDGGPAHLSMTVAHTARLLSGPCGEDDCNISLLDSGTPRLPGTIKRVVDISRPVVTESSFDYKSVVFRSGNTVAIDAGGCVQTGVLLGGTWKRYVNPSGPNSDHLYFGSMEIPAVSDFGNSPPPDILAETRFSSLVGKPSVNVPSIAPATLATLVLHYADYVYTDNGYYLHNDGTGNQCALGNDGGEAHITLTITPQNVFP
jgi:hypothetical protein